MAASAVSGVSFRRAGEGVVDGATCGLIFGRKDVMYGTYQATARILRKRN